jgi:hypothetical protein
LTLASLLRKKIIQVKGKDLVLTSLGEEAYKVDVRKSYLAWKDQLQQARELKRR